MRRAIDVHEGEKLDAPALKALSREAVALNASGKKKAPQKRASTSAKKAAPAKKRAAR